MSTDRSYFKIDRCPNYPERWYVDWTQLGLVERDITKYKLCEIVFDRIRPKWSIGIGYNVEHYRPKNPEMLMPRTTPFDPNDPIPQEAFSLVQEIKWEVRWISVEGWSSLQAYQYEQWVELLFRGRTPKTVVTGIILETLDQAEQFVDLMEAQFTFYRLKQDYA